MADYAMERYRTKYLMLLVGKNPLPNYVVAKLFEGYAKKIVFVHSAGTAKYADNIKNLLESGFEDYEHREVDVTNPEDIYSKIKSWLEEKKKSGEIRSTSDINLNYTGGTKSMSINAYKALSNVFKNGTINTSYLDARSLSLLCNDVSTGCVRDKVPVSIEDIVKLHGLEYKSNPRERIINCELSSKLYNMSLDPKKFDAFKQQISNELRKENDKTKWRPPSELKSKNVDINGKEHNIDQLRKEFGYNECEDVCKYLDGVWLEDYVLGLIDEIRKGKAGRDLKITDIAGSVNTYIGTGKKNNMPDFEVDVVVMKGYQLYAISCTTARERGLCKSKLLEVYVRSHQLGGDEARVCLIGYYNNSDDKSFGGPSERMELEIRNDLGGRDDYDDKDIKVILGDKIANLRNELYDWLES
ncbi:DUF1887 family protein [Calorimonas adulescens]|uniref:DUF1887 family protein n=1 Tax=Calorimonas adulescens TaxID=2606906 RepID=A0A5D8QCA2_9THEO|nr:DUF1887 family protein [Calorimonas adulescens]TZE82171.1 DUF1887 family protein [Calorimonas adulescens]